MHQYFGGAETVLHFIWWSVGAALESGEWWLCPSGVTCDPGDGSVTLKEVCSLFDTWDCTFSLPVGSKISWLMIILSRTGEILGERVQGTLWSKKA